LEQRERENDPVEFLEQLAEVIREGHTNSLAPAEIFVRAGNDGGAVLARAEFRRGSWPFRNVLDEFAFPGLVLCANERGYQPAGWVYDEHGIASEPRWVDLLEQVGCENGRPSAFLNTAPPETVYSWARLHWRLEGAPDEIGARLLAAFKRGRLEEGPGDPPSWLQVF
tara:strand:+ start:73 stop:576 length:504 start_codon:yes stop_codon:yes gene_type:complete